MPKYTYRQIRQRKYPDEIRWEALNARERLDALHERSDIVTQELLQHALQKLIHAYPTVSNVLIFPVAVKLLILDQLCEELLDIYQKKNELIEDTRHRIVCVRTGNMKLWIESRIPASKIKEIEHQIINNFKTLTLSLATIRADLEDGGMTAASIYPGKQWRTGHMQNRESRRLLETLMAVEEMEKSPYWDRKAAARSLPASVKAPRDKFLREFSIFYHAANELQKADPDMAQAIIRDFKQ